MIKYLLYIPMAPLILPVFLFSIIIIPVIILGKKYKTRKFIKQLNL